MKTLRALSLTFRHLFRKPETVQHPFVKRERPERFRASFALLHDENGEEACIGCKKCENICPSSVITVVPGGKKESPATGKKRGTAADFVLDLQACLVCELCVQVCPVDAIVMCKEPETPGFVREDLVLTMARLYENEKRLTPSWSIGSKLMVLHEPAPAEEKPAAAAGGRS